MATNKLLIAMSFTTILNRSNKLRHTQTLKKHITSINTKPKDKINCKLIHNNNNNIFMRSTAN